MTELFWLAAKQMKLIERYFRSRMGRRVSRIDA